MADEVEARVRVAEEELNLLKNQVQQTLLDVREHILDLVEPGSAIPRGDRPADSVDDGAPGGIGSVALPPTETGGSPAGAGGGLGDMPGLDMGGGGLGDMPGLDMGEDAGLGDMPGLDVGDEGGFGDMPGLDMGDEGGFDDMPGLGDGADGGDEFDMAEAPYDEGGAAPADGGFADAPFDDPGAGGYQGGGGYAPQGGYDDQGGYPADGYAEGEYPDAGAEDYEYVEDGAESDAPEGAIEDEVDAAEAASEAATAAGADATGLTPPPAVIANMDLVTLVSVVRWVDQAVQRIGQRRVDALLDVWQMTGRISEPTKDMIQTLCALTHEDEEERVPLRDLVAMMIQMEAVLDTEESTNSRLLAMLFEEPGDPLSGLGALASR